MSTLNLYPQFTYHDGAEIVGTREGLTLLRDALNEVLQSFDLVGSGAERCADVYASDGEGYQLSVICMDDDDDPRFPEPQYGFQEEPTRNDVDDNLRGADEFIKAILFNMPIWPNTWGQDVAAAAFFLTDNGSRSTARADNMSSAIREAWIKAGAPIP